MHLIGERKVVLDKCRGHQMLFAEWKDERLQLSPLLLNCFMDWMEMTETLVVKSTLSMQQGYRDKDINLKLCPCTVWWWSDFAETMKELRIAHDPHLGQGMWVIGPAYKWWEDKDSQKSNHHWNLRSRCYKRGNCQTAIIAVVWSCENVGYMPPEANS